MATNPDMRRPYDYQHRWFNVVMNRPLRTLLCILSCLACVSLASAAQDPAPVTKAIEDWLVLQTKDLPGQVSFEIGKVDRANQLAPCTAFDVSRPAGAQTWGRTNVLVRCMGDARWRLYVPVHVRIKSEYLVTARPISQGQLIGEDDLATQVGDLTELPARTVTEMRLAVGKVAAMTIPAGSPLRSDMLKAMLVIRQGQSVKVLSRGPGFEVANEGRALGNGSVGQVVQVRLASGQVISGVATSNGNIEVNY